MAQPQDVRSQDLPHSPPHTAPAKLRATPTLLFVIQQVGTLQGGDMFFLFALALAAYFGFLAAWLITLTAKLPGPISRGIFLTIVTLSGAAFGALLLYLLRDTHDALRKEEYNRINLLHHLAYVQWLPLSLLWLTTAITFLTLAILGLRKVGSTFRASHWPQARLLGSAITCAFIAAFLFQALDRAKKIELTEQASIVRKDLRQILAVNLPASENAAIEYQKLGQQFGSKGFSERYHQWVRTMGGGDVRKIYSDSKVIKYVDQLAPLIPKIRKAAAIPHRQIDIKNGDPDVESYVRQMALLDAQFAFRLLLISARIQADRGKQSEAIANLQAMQQMATQWTTEPDQYAYYYALMFQGEFCDELSRFLQAYPLSEPELDLLFSFSASDAAQRMPETVALEQTRDKAILLKHYVEQDYIGGQSSPLQKWWLKNLLDLERVFLSPTDLETAWAYHQDWQAVSGLRSFELLMQVDKIKQKQKSRYLGRSTMATTIGYDKMCRAIIQFEAMSRVTQLGIAAHRYHPQHGQYPAALSDLAQADPTLNLIDPFTNEPLKLIRQADHLLIYSVGPDLTDDGGLSYNGYGNNFDQLFRLFPPPPAGN